MKNPYGRYTSEDAYEHAKALRRRNARRWRRNNKKREKIEWFRSDTKSFINKYANDKDKQQLRKLINQRLKEGVK